VLATPLLRLRAPVLAAVAAVWCVAGPVLSHVLRAGPWAWPGEQPGPAVAARAGSALLPVAPGLVAVLVIAVAVRAAAVCAAGRRGPLEAAVPAVSSGVRRAVAWDGSVTGRRGG
jgi:hypothetical protein